MKRLLAALVALVLVAAVPGTARADERILHYLSDVTVGQNGNLNVTETIRVRSEGDSIKHGIYRDFPTRYRTGLGRQMRVGFKLLDVQRDGQPEKWKESSLSNGVRIYVGDEAIFVPPGEHLYRLHYEATRLIGYFDDFDELYWNATGNGWMFPIDVAEARITLPKPIRFGERHVYTGPQGSTAENAEVIADEPGLIAFRTTVPLGPNDGLTVAARWPKGVVALPAQEQRARWWLEDNGPPAAAVLGVLALLAYYVFAWKRAGRDPSAGTIVPLFSPQDNMSAAGMRYVEEMGADSRAFAAALIDLGVRGKVRLVEGEKPWFGKPKTTIEKTGDESGLPDAERGMMNALFASGNSILMDNKNHSRFSAAQQALTKSFKSQFEGRMFVRNVTWALRGLGLMFTAIWLVALVIVFTDGSGALPQAALMVGLGSLLAVLVAAFLLYAKPKSGSRSTALGILAGIAGLAALCLGVITIVLALGAGQFLPLLFPLLSLPIVISAFWWMAAPTREGRGVLDRIAGFRQYLSITEEERLDRMHPPEKTPALFEKYLPFAIALGVENEWADQFAGVLAAAAAAGQAQGMAWYSGHSDPWSHPSAFADTMGSSLSSTVSSASTAPGSSSGSGGGGSSGGGGGGGGGGGW